MIYTINEARNGIFDNVKFYNESSTNNKWKYKIELADQGVFDKLEKDFNIKIPKILRNFIKDHNAATPQKYHFKVGNVERVFGAVLSFNKKDMDNIFSVLKSFKYENKIPFAVDPFGNLIVYSGGNIEFWNHETDIFTKVGNSLNSFIESLY